MSIRVVGVEQYEVTIFVGLCLFHLRYVFAERCVFIVDTLVECKAGRFVVEFLIGEHAELDKHLDVVPFLGELIFVGFV